MLCVVCCAAGLRPGLYQPPPPLQVTAHNPCLRPRPSGAAPHLHGHQRLRQRQHLQGRGAESAGRGRQPLLLLLLDCWARTQGQDRNERPRFRPRCS